MKKGHLGEHGACSSNVLEVINALSHQYIGEEKDVLHNYASWDGLEAYRRGVTVTNYFLSKWIKKIRKYLYGRSRPYIYL